MNHRQRAQQALDEAYERIISIYGKRGAMPKPKLRFDLRGVCAGKARLAKNIVDINEAHLIRHTDEILEDTIPHEVAHFAAWFYFKDTGHGVPWQGVMMALGLEPRRCYEYDGAEFKVRQVKRPYVYACACSEHKLTAIRHRRARRGHPYVCVDCGRKLVYKGSTSGLTLKDLGL